MTFVLPLSLCRLPNSPDWDVGRGGQKKRRSNSMFEMKEGTLPRLTSSLVTAKGRGQVPEQNEPSWPR